MISTTSEYWMAIEEDIQCHGRQSEGLGNRRKKGEFEEQSLGEVSGKGRMTTQA